MLKGINITKELLLFLSVAVASAGVAMLEVKVWQGLLMVVISAALFIARGWYKKYLNK